MFMSKEQWVEAGKIKKGDLILVEGKRGHRVVTRREKWNDTHVRIHHAHPDPAISIASFEYVRLTDQFEIYQGETCRLCTKKYMPQSSCYEGFCGYGCLASHAFITPSETKNMIPLTPPIKGALIDGTVGGRTRSYEIKVRPPNEYSRSDDGIYELCTKLDSGTWLNDQERFETWGAVIEFFHYLSLKDIEYLYY